MVRERLLDRKVGEEMLIDIAHYKQRSNCKGLVCFVYDPTHMFKNPRALDQDLSKETDGLKVRVMVRPLARTPTAVVRWTRRCDSHPVQYTLGMYAELVCSFNQRGSEIAKQHQHCEQSKNYSNGLPRNKNQHESASGGLRATCGLLLFYRQQYESKIPKRSKNLVQRNQFGGSQRNFDAAMRRALPLEHTSIVGPLQHPSYSGNGASTHSFSPCCPSLNQTLTPSGPSSLYFFLEVHSGRHD
jgi:hypothetical protein